MADREPERRKVGAHAPGTLALAGVAAALREQAAHSTTPRMLHMLHTKRPQSPQGYPSDARSSLPQARQVIASRSCRSAIVFSGIAARARSARARVEPVVLDLLDQRGARDAELARGVRSVPLVRLERPLDVHPFGLLQRHRHVMLR